jgi:hypothetical protein
MSDGPHKSLPMRRHWRRLAERAAIPAYSSDEVNEAICAALKKEFREAPLSRVADILRGDEQGSLFAEARTEDLDSVRHVCPGSVAGTTFIDCAIEAALRGLPGDEALHFALTSALAALARSGCRQMEEHFQRKGFHAAELRERLRAARNDCRYGVLASEIIGDRRAQREVTKRSGVDEGPSL